MTTFVDFAEVKASVSFETLIDRLGLKMKRQGAQFRGPCPICRSGGDRALVITPAKGAFYCFAAQRGGDAIALVAHIQGVAMKDAAHWIAGSSGEGTARAGTDPDTAPNERKGNGARGGLKPLTYLDPRHAALAPLDLSPETFEQFEAGYAPRGIMRGRLAIPLHDPDGRLVAYAGRAIVEAQEPRLIFPKAFDPARLIFNAHRVGEGEVTLARDPLVVLQAFEAGIENVVAVLTETITPGQLAQVAALMELAGCDSIEIY